MLPDGTIDTALDRARTNRLPGTPFNGAKLPHLVVCALPESHEFAVPVVGMRRSNSAWDATFLLAHSSSPVVPSQIAITSKYSYEVTG